MEMEAILKALEPNESGALQRIFSNPVERITLNSDIELTEEELIDAIVHAKVQKRRKLEHDQAEERRIKRFNDLLREFTPEEMLAACHEFYQQRFGKEFLIDDHNRELVHKLSYYFSNNQEFEAMGYSLSKGIIIMGPVGTGKTDLMRFFQRNKRSCYEMVPCTMVADSYRELGDDTITYWSTPIQRPYQDPDVYFQKISGRCFDDLGTEEVKIDFGNKKDVMADVLFRIYEKGASSINLITTNLQDNKAIEERYGSRIVSRLREGYNVFVLGGPDRRK